MCPTSANSAITPSSEALVEARHPDRFTPARTARWRGRIYNAHTSTLRPQRIYRGVYGSGAYQSVYQDGGHLLDLIHQLGVPVAAILLLTAPLGLIASWAALPAAAAAISLGALAAVDVARAEAPRRAPGRQLAFRAKVAVHHLLQPLARFWGRMRHRHLTRRDVGMAQSLPVPVRELPGGIVVARDDRPRAELAAALLDTLRRRGVRAVHPSGWEDYDARLLLSTFAFGDLQTSSHPEGFVQIRIRSRPRVGLLAVAVAAIAAGSVLAPPVAVVLLLPVLSVAHGAVRARRLPGQILAPAGQRP